jgi:hypothetical protein
MALRGQYPATVVTHAACDHLVMIEGQWDVPLDELT